MPVLNVKPQSSDVSTCKPPQRFPVTIRDHHQTWLANYEEIRKEVNKASCKYDGVIDSRTLVYRNHNGDFGANTLFARSFALGSSNPNVSAGGSPISISPDAFRTGPGVEVDIQGPTTFSNTVSFAPGSSLFLDGDLVVNNVATFNGTSNFYDIVRMHPSSTLFVDGLSYFTEDVQIDANLELNGDFTTNGDIVQTGNTTISGSLDLGDNLIVRGNLSVLGDHTALEVQDLKVEDKNILVNAGDIGGAEDSGIWIQHLANEQAGYMRVDKVNLDELTFKAPTGYEMKLQVPTQDVTFRIEGDFTADQQVSTDANVFFRSVTVDQNYSRHGNVPSVTQQVDPIATDKGWVSTPWVYTNVVESNDRLDDANTTGLFMGTSVHTFTDEIALLSQGEAKVFVNHFGKIGMGTKAPISDLHLLQENATFTISTNDYDTTATLAFTDFGERYDDAGMYVSYDANTGHGLLELTTQSPTTQFAISVGGYEKLPEMTITNSTVTIHDDVEIYGSEYVSNDLIVDHTMFVRSADRAVGINVISPSEALDVSGNIRGDSDLILDGLEPFTLIGNISTLEPMGRSGLAIEEESPLISLSTTESSYRHGSIVYFNDVPHTSHWSWGTVNNGSAIDFGRSFDPTANTPEYGLDEYHGNTLMRFRDTNQADFYLHATSNDPAMRLNTRTNGIHLYLGEQNSLRSLTTPTTSYTANTFSSSVQWHGNTATSTIGEISYFPEGDYDGEFGSFRFSRTDGNVNTNVPSAKVGANQFYANDKIGISQTAPTAELHITKDVSRILQETQSTDQYFSVDVNTNDIVLTGNNVSGLSSFTLSALNPAEFNLHSSTHDIFMKSDHSTDELKIDLANPKSNVHLQTLVNDSELRIRRDLLDYTMNLNDSKTANSAFQTATLKDLFDFNDQTHIVTRSTEGYGVKSSYELNGSSKHIISKDEIMSSASREIELDGSLHSITEHHEVTDGTNIAVDQSILKPVIFEANTTVGNYEVDSLLDPTQTHFLQKNDTLVTSNKLYNSDTESALNVIRETSRSDEVVTAIGNLSKNWTSATSYLNIDMTPAGLITESFSDGASGGEYHLHYANKDIYRAYDHGIDIECDAIFKETVTFEKGLTYPTSTAGQQNFIHFDMNDPDAPLNDSNVNNNYIKWSAKTDEGSIRFTSSGDTATRIWGFTNETVQSSRMIFETGDNGDEGFEFKNGTNQLLFIDNNRLFANRTIRQTHQNTLIEYQSPNKWLLKDENSNDGLYWNLNAGSYKFSDASSFNHYTNPEDEANQFVFVQNGIPKAAIDLDTGSFRTTGDVVADNDVIGFVTSDIVFKENVKILQNPLEMIDGLNGVNFEWKENPSGYKGKDIGVIAQDVQKIIPEAVRTGANGQMQVNYEKIIPLLIECIKELKAKIGE